MQGIWKSGGLQYSCDKVSYIWAYIRSVFKEFMLWQQKTNLLLDDDAIFESYL